MFLIGFEVIQRCVQANGEALVAPLAFPVSDVFLLATFAIANQCVDALIGDSKIITPGIGTGMTFGRDALLTAACTFALRVGDDIRVRLQNCQRDAGLTTRAVIR